ncbi:DUF4188 domain-containing protein [Occallatibacter riparius]|uniref:DUF4188 domain-containing protein n=1 Tax=Occallatibacter riparius TaxID=1002689 RepID=A0A9J7BL61_9BACT|nr:DUF4188 domain-containing protein [Occallatibacter riparius]UWZ81981.1 DUF4188 domain-containing protein [Occallatibacter riparius]
MPIFPGRYTARTDEPFVVFLIGMRVNRFFQFGKWMQVAKAMPPMIAELKKRPELGLLHVETALYWRGVVNIQYWRSFEHLHSYAKMKEGLHLPAWAAFNRAIGNNGAVGIWHETFVVQPGNHEAVYVNMPRFGLAAGVAHTPVTGRLDSAYGRMQSSERTDSNLVEK